MSEIKFPPGMWMKKIREVKVYKNTLGDKEELRATYQLAGGLTNPLLDNIGIQDFYHAGTTMDELSEGDGLPDRILLSFMTQREADRRRSEEVDAELLEAGISEAEELLREVHGALEAPESISTWYADELRDKIVRYLNHD